MKLQVLLTVLLVSSSVLAKSNIPLEQQIGSITTIEITDKFIENDGSTPTPPVPGKKPMDYVEDTRKVISVAKDMIALGEAIYELVKKGKPTNTTEYAPISVVPKNPTTKEYIDPFELENFSMPEEKSFVTSIKNGVGKEVVSFTYTVIYSHGGSYEGKGKYLTNVIIVPKSVRTTFGWDFNASMKLSGIMNHGSKESPVAGVMVTVKYQMNSWSASFERNDTIHLTGRGELKTFGPQ